jgi:hypothetical protein
VRQFTRRTRPSRAWLLAAAAQGTASITNFAAAALALSSGNLAEFGRFSIAYQLGLVMVSIGEASTGSAALIQGSRELADAERQSLSDGTAGAALVLGATLAVPIAIAGVVVGGPLGLSLLLVAFGTPGLVSQYTLRGLRFARHDQLGVLRADSIWLAVVLGGALVDVLSPWRGSPTAYLAVWLAGGTISAAPLIRAGVVRGRRQLRTFWLATGPQAIRYGFAGLLSRSVFVVPLIATAVIVGTEATGALAAAVVVFSPLSVVNTTAGAITIPSQIRKLGVHVVDKRIPLQVIAGVSAITLGWAGCLLALEALGLPSGPFALSANGITAALFTATLLRFLGLAFLRGPAVGLMIADASAETLESRIVGTLATWVAAVVGLQLAGVDGGAFGLAVATWFGAWVTWRRYRALPRHLLRISKQPLGGAGSCAAVPARPSESPLAKETSAVNDLRQFDTERGESHRVV